MLLVLAWSYQVIRYTHTRSIVSWPIPLMKGQQHQYFIYLKYPYEGISAKTSPTNENLGANSYLGHLALTQLGIQPGDPSPGGSLEGEGFQGVSP